MSNSAARGSSPRAGLAHQHPPPPTSSTSSLSRPMGSGVGIGGMARTSSAAWPLPPGAAAPGTGGAPHYSHPLPPLQLPVTNALPEPAPPLHRESDDRFEDAIGDGDTLYSSTSELKHSVWTNTPARLAENPVTATPRRPSVADASMPVPRHDHDHRDHDHHHQQQYSSVSPVRALGISTSTSSTSLSSNLRGRRAPAPAALDLSPRAERVIRQEWDALHKWTMTSDRDQHDQRGLINAQPSYQVDNDRPDHLHETRTVRSESGPPLVTSNPPSRGLYTGPAPFLTPAPPPVSSTTASAPLAVPLSAFGTSLDDHRDSDRRESLVDRRVSVASSGDRLGLAEGRFSIDSYYLGPSSGRLSPPQPASFTPSTPEYLDPSNIDRRGLVGVGELATPRWTANRDRHLRTPSTAYDLGTSPPMPPAPERFLAGSVPARGVSSSPGPSASSGPSSGPTSGSRPWSKADGETGLGLGVGLMARVSEESSSKERVRQRAVSHHESPSRSTRQSHTAPPSALADLDSLLALSGGLGEFNFDSDIEPGELAASLAMPSPPRHLRTSAPPTAFPISLSQSPFTAAPLVPSKAPDMAPLIPSKAADLAPSTGPMVSPGSARERIYARRASRQFTASSTTSTSTVGTTGPQTLDFPPSPLKFSPPNSADASNQTFASRRDPRDARKTPPSTQRERERDPSSASSKRRLPASPNAPHHDILKHIAPKDFSHLPPSPSSASINQFLRSSGSTTTLSRDRSPGRPNAAVPQSNYFAPKSTLGRSDSGRSRGASLKPGDSLAAETVHAIRKLDGLTSTPGKKSSSGSGSVPTPRSIGRPSTPPDTMRKLATKASASSIRSAMAYQQQQTRDSPLGSWLEISNELSVLSTPVRGSRMRDEHRDVSGSEPLSPLQPQSSPSLSVIATPTSRDSNTHSHATPTTPSSARGDKSQRRQSGTSDSSADGMNGSSSGILASLDDRPKNGTVPPVPPLPRGYMSMRQGLAGAANGPSNQPTYIQPTYVPLREEEPMIESQLEEAEQAPVPLTASLPSVTPGEPRSPPTSVSGLSDGSTTRPRAMNKKWSFSSALNLKLGGGHKGSPTSPPTLSPSLPVSEPKEQTSSPHTPWTEIDRFELASPRELRIGLGLEPTITRDSSDVSRASVTPIAPTPVVAPSQAPAPAPVQNQSLALPQSSSSGTKTASKRLTPSSIPFFRRASASSVASSQQKITPTEPPRTPRSTVNSSNSLAVPAPQSTQRTPSGTRKSMLGMHIPNMLRGSASKRGLSQQLASAPVQPVATQEPKTATTGSSWAGRSRGMTLSSGGDKGLVPPIHTYSQPANQIHAHTLGHKPSAEGRASMSLNRHEGTMNDTTTKPLGSNANAKLQTIMASPPHVIHAMTSSSSLRKDARGILPSATPTKIPRIASRPLVSTPNMNTHAHTHHSSHSSMPPPALPSTISTSRSAHLLSTIGGAVSGAGRTVTASMSHSDFGLGVNEFGAIGGSGSSNSSSAQARQTSATMTSSAHRAHLLAPMSMRKQTATSAITTRTEAHARRELALPTTKRTLPHVPSSSATAMTISAAAKARPNVSRRGSSSTNGSGGGEVGVANSTTVTPSTAPIKQSKSVHSKLSIPAGVPTTKLTTSSSVGMPGSSHISSLLPDADSPGEDEESLADAEMGSYVTRRRARAANAVGSKKDDLADLIGFPEDVDPAEPVSQRTFVTRYLSSLSDFERKEVLDFDHIFYVAPNVARPAQPDGKVYNHGYDDERGDYVVVPGDHLCYRYEVVGILGKGSFGQVVHCRDHKTGSSVAVKIIRNKKRFHTQALVEVKILQQIVEWDPDDKHFMVKMTDHFYFRSHLCIVTELLSINLYELIKANQFSGFSTVLIRRFTTQMLSSLLLMRSHRIVHCDLKPENILLRHPAKSGIKVIDFGSSCHESEKVYTYIQSRFYRSPEVILGMNYAMAIDMWSLGCILAELYTGYPIFPGENEHEQLACIMEVLGVPDNYLVTKASRKKLFFDSTGAPRPFVSAKGKRRRPGTKTLSSVLKCNDELFLDFIAKCLTWDPDKRLKPQPAMRHPWILAGRRRNPPPPPERDIREPSQSRASLLSGRIRGSTTLNGSGGSGGNGNVNGNVDASANGSVDKKALIISPPTPLMPRQATQVPTSAPRIGPSISTTRLHHPRNSTYVSNAQKVSMA